LRPPSGAPNVLVILLDDVGLRRVQCASAALATHRPAERLATHGLKYTRFHTTAICSPTRALLSGRNHHAVGMGGITEMATSAPGYSSMRPNTCAPLAGDPQAEWLRDGAVRQVHEVRPWETSPAGPSTGGQQGSGFEHFFGFVGGETDQWFRRWSRALRGAARGARPEEGYHFTEDLTDKAIAWVRQQKALVPDKQFFMYFAPGATHAPHHVPKAWADKYKGKFDHGWDRQRELTLARQKELGSRPGDAELTKRHDEIPPGRTRPRR
jgi:arylsulfatase